MKKKTIHSHVEIPKQLYKKFAFNNQDDKLVVNYLDKDLTIKEKELDLIGAEDFYFSDEMEEFLNNTLETPLGEVIKRLSNQNKKELSNNEKSILNKMIHYTPLRNKDFFQSFSSLTKTNMNHEQFIKFFSNSSNENLDNFIVMVNKTDIPLIMSNNLITYLIFTDEECCEKFCYDYQVSAILPLDKDKFILIGNQNVFSKKILTIPNGLESIITRINLITYFLFKDNSNSIIFGCKDELIRISKLYESLINQEINQ